MSSVPYHAWTHRSKARGGTDPIEDATGDYAFMTWDSGGAVTVNTLTSVASIGGADYDTGFSVDFGAFDGGIDLNNGIIQIGDYSGWFLAQAWAQFDGGATAGSHLGVALDFGNGGTFGTYRVGNMIIASGISEVMRIPVSKTWQRFADTGHDSVMLRVWHNDAGGQDLNSAYLSVTYITPNTTGTFFP